VKGLRRRLRRSWKDNIEMDLKEVERENVDWIFLSRDRANGGIL
jgi:hypothetical protein